MIRYSLRCAQSHDFESWFQSAAGFDSLCAAAQVACPVCGGTEVEKTLMTPALNPARKAGEPARLAEPQTEAERAMAQMRAHVEANSDYVGVNFAAEARRMHEGEIDQRSIYGEAKPEEALALLEDGVPIAPLPFMPTRKAN
jgi:hypothetical protein